MNASFWDSLDYSADVPFPLTCRNPCRASFRETVTLMQLFMMEMIVFQITSTRPLYLYYPRPFGMRIMVVHASSAVRQPSRNCRCIILTTPYHLVLIWYFYYVASLSHDLRCSARITDGPPALTVWGLCTAATILSLLGESLLITAI